MNSKKSCLIAAAILALPVMVQAQPVNGFYLGAGLGGNDLQKTDITGTFRPVFTKLEGESNEFETGYAGVISLGWGFGNGLRAEIEGSYRRNETDGHIVFDIPRQKPVGTASSYGGMGNIFYDFDLRGALGGLSPYLGIGVGYIWHRYDDVGFRDNARLGKPYENTYNSSGNSVGSAPGAFAGQVIAGLSWPIAAVPGLSVTGEYRFLGTTGHTFNRNTVSGVTYVADAEVDNYNHSVLVGLRYAFNARPAIAAAPAPVAAERSFLVFFDWDRADLTDRARQIIGEAASARSAGVTRIEVNGHADRSGSPQHNQTLSVRRAEAVAAELVRRGVPRNEIVTRGFGEQNPLVPTADDVREPQNRRVEIILR